MNTAKLKQEDQQYIAHTYGRFDVCIVEGKNATCIDSDGKKYIDFTSGIGVNSLGYCNEIWTKAICEQAKTLNHISNLYYNIPNIQLAKKLAEMTGYDKVCFSNSGAEANECAIKLARKNSFDKFGKGRSTIITLVNSFHGRTVTTLSATGQDNFHQYFFPFTEGFRYVPANDLEALKNAIDDTVCAVMCEMIQGEGGVIPLNQNYVKEVEVLCKQHNLTLIVDEVQTGMGRTGSILCCEQYQIQPDLVTLAKGLGGGLPIGAVLIQKGLSQVFQPGDHGSTFAGNPIACAGALAVLQQLTPDFLEQVKKKGQIILTALTQSKEVTGIDGIGLMLGIGLKTKKALQVAQDCIKQGLLVLTAKDKIRLLPPLTISQKELLEGIEILKNVLNG